jgi:hypothetical protein
MAHRRSLLRELTVHFGQLARDIQMSDGSIRLTVNQQWLAKIATSLSYYHHRPHHTHSAWTLRHDPWDTAVRQIPKHVTSDLETMVTDLVPDFGWVEVSIHNFDVSNIMIHVSLQPPSHVLAC